MSLPSNFEAWLQRVRPTANHAATYRKNLLKAAAIVVQAVYLPVPLAAEAPAAEAFPAFLSSFTTAPF